MWTWELWSGTEKGFQEGGGGVGVKREPIGSLPAVTKQNHLTGRKVRPIVFKSYSFPQAPILSVS